jgi:hypothetical protein
MNPVSSKYTFLRVWDREFRTTDLRSFADAALEAKTHERSRSAGDLAWQCVTDEPVIASIAEKPVHDLGEAAHRDAMQKVDSLTEEDLGRTVTSIVHGDRAARSNGACHSRTPFGPT